MHRINQTKSQLFEIIKMATFSQSTKRRTKLKLIKLELIQMKSIELKKYFRNFILKNIEEMDKILDIMLFQDINNVRRNGA